MVDVTVWWFMTDRSGRPLDPAQRAGRVQLPARFETRWADWPEEVWTVVLDFAGPQSASRSNKGKAALFRSDTAPQSLLAPGSRFYLYDGTLPIAVCLVA